MVKIKLCGCQQSRENSATIFRLDDILKEVCNLRLFKDFKKVSESEVEEYTINKYKNMLPEDLIEAWKTYRLWYSEHYHYDH